MADKQGISTVLKRNLKVGKEYDKLIPRVKCERTNLGEGDTFHTVDAMKSWVESYSFQTAKLAPLLVGHNLEETVNNIYTFLYNHVQYEADGSLQQLRSPACTWAQRKTGVDCKSYSVFASSILSNLGIKHMIRQVRQPYFFPEEFTHVYVVVPKHQNSKDLSNSATFVLDATKHQNVESNYLEKVDLPMTKLSHVGLNAPQDERTQQIIQNFEKFCQFLIQKGIPLSTVNAMRERVSQFTSIGIDPRFTIVDEGIVIEGKLFPLQFPGLGFAVTAAVGAATAGKKLLDILPPNLVSDTFGAVFSNGFDLGCWNTASSPSEAQKVIAEEYMPFIEERFKIIQNPTNLEAVKKAFNEVNEFVTKSHAFHELVSGMSKYAKCSRKGWKTYADFLSPILARMGALLTTLSSEYNITTKKVAEEAYFQQQGKKTGTYKVKPPYDVITSISSKSIFGGGSVQTPQIPTGGSNYQPTSGGNGSNFQPSENQNINGSNGNNNGESNGSGGTNTALLIGGGVLAAGFFLMPMMKKGSVAANMPNAKKPAAKKPATRKKKK